MNLGGRSYTGEVVFGELCKRGVLLLLCSMLLAVALFSLPVNASQQEPEAKRTIEVILTDYDDAGYVIPGQDGADPTGYYVEYLEEIAKYTNWEFEYRIVSDESILARLARNQNFDLMIGVDYTKESEELYFEYPQKAMGSRRLVLATVKTNSKIDAEDSETLKGIRVGVISSARNQELEEKFTSFCFSNELECVSDSPTDFQRGINLIHVREEERFEMLDSGQLDAIITSDSTALSNNLYVVDTFGRMPFYAVIAKGKTDILEELDNALNSIKGQDSQFEEQLYNKYFASNMVSELVFNQQEQEFLGEGRNYRVAMWDGCAPYGYVNDEGQWSGLAVDVFGEITRMTEGKITFEYVSCADSFEANKLLTEGKADILGYTFSSINAATRGDNRSRRYYTDNFHLFCNEDAQLDSDGEITVAIKKDFPDALLAGLGMEENVQILRVETVADALIQVNEGNADMTIALGNVGDYYSDYYRLDHLDVLDTSLSPVSFCCVFGEHVEQLAKDICNQCIRHLDSKALDRSITETILLEHKEVGVREFIRNNWTQVVTTFAIMMIMVVILLIVVVLIINSKSKRIYRMLYQDEITGGISFLKFEEEVTKLIEGKGEQYYVLFGDISSFKYINDVFGYEVGDSVLKKVEDLFGELAMGNPYTRMYADHFVALCSFEHQKDLEQHLDRKLREFARECIRCYEDFNIFLKIGIYHWDTSSQRDIRQTVNLACYAADTMSDLSKSAYCFYTMEMHDRVLNRQEIEKDMHRAMSAGEFVAYFQPKYDIESERIIGAEALVRWKHRTRGLISPGAFIPVFEKNGFIIELDFCMFRQVCAFLAKQQAEGKELYVISCNFSRRHFKQADFVERLLEVVEHYKVPTQYLEIEITETVATTDFDALIETVNTLKEHGFQISIDDFGSGYSCIQLLYKLPLDVLKLDRVFVLAQDAGNTEVDVNRSIVDICRNNDIKVICEGVETHEQKQYVESYGCRYVQGFLYSKPVDMDTFSGMLETQAEG